MAMGFKVVEEVGELFDAALTELGYQRKSKLQERKDKDIDKEFADAIFTILILAKRFNIDVEQAIKMKMDEIKKRNYKD